MDDGRSKLVQWRNFTGAPQQRINLRNDQRARLKDNNVIIHMWVFHMRIQGGLFRNVWN